MHGRSEEVEREGAKRRKGKRREEKVHGSEDEESKVRWEGKEVKRKEEFPQMLDAKICWVRESRTEKEESARKNEEEERD